MVDVVEGSRKWFLFNVSFLCIGIGYLFPFSALTQPIDFWKFLFPEHNLNFSIAAYYNYTNLVVLGLIVWLKPQGSIVNRITLGFAGQILALVLIPTLWFFTPKDVYYYCIMTGTCFLAIVTAFLDCSVISLGMRFPGRMQESLQLGIGISTLIGSFYRLLTKAIFPPDWIVYSSVAYFYTGAVTIVLCLFAFFYLIRESGIAGFGRQKDKIPNNEVVIIVDDVEDETTEDDSSGSSASRPEGGVVGEESAPLVNIDTMPPTPLSKLLVIRRILWNETLVIVMFCITLAVWPAIISELPYFEDIPGISREWWPLLLLAFFAVSDVIGRFIVSYVKIPGLSHRTIWIPIFIRLAFVPLIAWQCSPTRLFGPLPGALSSDFWTLFLVFFFGFSNGYVGTLAIISVNDCCRSAAEKTYAGTLTSFFLNTGLVLGASMGLAFEKLVLES